MRLKQDGIQKTSVLSKVAKLWNFVPHAKASSKASTRSGSELDYDGRSTAATRETSKTLLTRKMPSSFRAARQNVSLSYVRRLAIDWSSNLRERPSQGELARTQVISGLFSTPLRR